MPDSWFLYLIRCSRGTLYTGITTDVDRRFAEHREDGPKAARYLRGKGPLQLVYQTPVADRSTASRLELRVKRLSRGDKDRLVEGVLNIDAL